MAEGSHVASRFVRVPNKLCRGRVGLSSISGRARARYLTRYADFHGWLGSSAPVRSRSRHHRPTGFIAAVPGRHAVAIGYEA